MYVSLVVCGWSVSAGYAKTTLVLHLTCVPKFTNKSHAFSDRGVNLWRRVTHLCPSGMPWGIFIALSVGKLLLKTMSPICSSKWNSE